VLSNLTTLQTKALNSLAKNKNIIIKATDKNLGLAVMDSDKYTLQILQEHLLTKDYSQLTRETAAHRMEDIKTTLKNLIATQSNTLSRTEITFFKGSLQLQHRLPIFYGLPKVHKDPIALQPVVSTTNSFLAVFSVWLDYKMKDLLPLINSHTKNSTRIIKELEYKKIPANARLFTADTKSMYTNIETDLGINTIKDFLNHNTNNLPVNFPSFLFREILEIFMCNNIFTFRDTYWQQLTGTAMGT
jgi:hypothetical protein